MFVLLPVMGLLKSSPWDYIAEKIRLMSVITIWKEISDPFFQEQTLKLDSSTWD